MEKTFFDYISSADSEKTHSQTIGWIFSKNCQALTQDDKSKFLKEITKSTCEFNIQNSLVEINDIDILIICEDALVVIENKIKATESKSQLGKYFDIVENGVLSYLKENRRRFYIYLTLFEENSSQKNYIDHNYGTMHLKINELLKKPDNPSRDYFILKDYLKTIDQLTRSINFIENSKDIRKWVFENPKTRKDNQTIIDNSISDEIKYIISNGLVRQMQKYYFKKVKDNLSLDLKFFNINYGSSANNGEGLIQIDFLKYKYKHNRTDFQIGYQIQGSVVKINTASKDYNNSKPEDMHPQIKAHMEDLKNSVQFRSRNPPITKAYYSISKFLPNKIYEYSPKELAEYIETEIKGIEANIEQLWKKLK
jgi:hypothetical protein